MGSVFHGKGQTIFSPHSSLFTITNTALFCAQLSTLAQAIGLHVHPPIVAEAEMEFPFHYIMYTECILCLCM